MVEVDFKAVEEKWQGAWEKEELFVADDNSEKPKYYCLEMFPYPSGSGLHMGHAWNYTIGDIISRFKMMNGFEVLHPMGYDALGLPAENAAIQAGTHPEDYNKASIANYIKQQKAIGLTYDWSRMVSTDDPKFYKWDQWIFLKMLEKGLAYQKKSAVNWCPKCDTVLANEQVVDGKCWRHDDTDVVVKHLTQWFLKITDYADELYENLPNMDWPDRTKAMQKHWIGKSHGTEIDFLVELNGKSRESGNGERVTETWPVFTTRADTIFGVTFVVVAAGHSKLDELVTPEQREAVDFFLKNVKSVSEKEMADMEKMGVFTGSYAINPANGEKVPIYAGNFVVADYGSGMVMAVPAHDQRDFEFAKKYKIDIKQVIEGDVTSTRAFTEKGKLINSGEFDGLEGKDAIERIASWLEEKGSGRKVVNFRLRDWGISRQRYWGTPIPIIHCEDCGAVPVPEKDLPVKLPKDVKFGEGNPLETAEDWLKVDCPKCGKVARREAETMDTFVNSSWYFLRYCDANNDEEIFDPKKVKTWCPVDTYIGGAEHACMHLIYSRFYVKFLRDLGLLDFDEPAKKLFHQGMLMGEGGIKMSKSKGNVVLPETVSDKYGIDTARFFLSSLASPDKDIDWSEAGIVGSLRFVNKIFEFAENFEAKEDSEELEVKLNNVVKNVTEYYDNFQYRKATIDLRALFDLMEKGCSKDAYEKFLKMINPICPHITEELWEKLGNEGFISVAAWPTFDENKLKIKKKEVDLNAKAIEMIRPHLEKTDVEKVHIYVMPFEVEKMDIVKIGGELGKHVFIYSVKDGDKYDPQGKAKKSRPGMPSFFLE